MYVHTSIMLWICAIFVDLVWAICGRIGVLCEHPGDCCNPLICQLTMDPVPPRSKMVGVPEQHLLRQIPSRNSAVVPSALVSQPRDYNRTAYYVGLTPLSTTLAKRCRYLPAVKF